MSQGSDHLVSLEIAVLMACFPLIGSVTSNVPTFCFQIGQTVFSGIQTLNRIQSIVFNTAYHTNENLLICAPTGAGKTNVALLTIVHEMKQNMENGVIKKDQFKVSINYL